jgi:serine phosphatase RsbU (regulator of sigma subunit)/PAS domain-containing protein
VSVVQDSAATASGTHVVDSQLLRAVNESDAPMAVLYLLRSDAEELRMAAMVGMSAEIVSPWLRIGLTAPTPTSDAVRERRLVWVGSQEELARHYPRVAVAFPYRFAVAVAPILTGGTCWGALALLWPASHGPRLLPHERDALGAACDRLGTVLRRAAGSGRPVHAPTSPRMVPARRSRPVGPAEAQAAVDFADRLPEGCCALDIDGRIRFINDTGADLVGCGVADLTGEFPWVALPWLRDPVFEDRYRAAIVSREPTSFTAVRPPGRRLSFQLYPDSSGVSVRITPAPGPPGGATGSPSVPSPEPVRAGALYHLMHLAAAFTEAVGVRDVVDLAAEQVMPAFDLQGFVLLAVEGGRLRVIGHRGYRPEFFDWVDGASLRTLPTPAAAVLATGAGRFYATPDAMEQDYPGMAEHSGKAAWAILPLIVSGRPLGTCVLSYDHPHTFSLDERAAMTSVAGLLGQALDRARLYDAKHQLARRLQTGLLPAALPEIPGLEVAARYLPATRGVEIGGDFYDLIRLDSGGAAATIGDVQGHNVTAASLMGQVRTAVHATAGALPGDVLARTNRLLTDLDPGLFTSCLYLHLDLRGHRARLATAGHLPPLLCHPDGRTTTVRLPAGLLLGIDATAEYPTTEIPMPPGAMLVLFTDGLVETSGVDFDAGTAALAERLGSLRHQPVEALADTLLRQTEHTASRNDDIALLLLRTIATPRT